MYKKSKLKSGTEATIRGQYNVKTLEMQQTPPCVQHGGVLFISIPPQIGMAER